MVDLLSASMVDFGGFFVLRVGVRVCVRKSEGLTLGVPKGR